jgi:hypothetical protein
MHRCAENVGKCHRIFDETVAAAEHRSDAPGIAFFENGRSPGLLAAAHFILRLRRPWAL